MPQRQAELRVRCEELVDAANARPLARPGVLDRVLNLLHTVNVVADVYDVGCLRRAAELAVAATDDPGPDVLRLEARALELADELDALWRLGGWHDLFR